MKFNPIIYKINIVEMMECLFAFKLVYNKVILEYNMCRENV